MVVGSSARSPRSQCLRDHRLKARCDTLHYFIDQVQTTLSLFLGFKSALRSGEMSGPFDLTYHENVNLRLPQQ